MAKDIISEMLTGEKGSVKCIGKFYIMPTMSEVENMSLVMVAGAVVSPCGGKLVLPENEKYSEMWECEIIIIPKRKYSGTYGTSKREQRFGITNHAFGGYRVDQVLAGNYGDPKAWGREYFAEEK